MAFRKRRVLLALLLLLVIPTLQACAGDSLVLQTLAVPSPSPRATPRPPTLMPVEPLLERANALVIALDEEPDTFYTPLSTTAAQRLVDYAIREPWVTSRGYEFQPNPRFLAGDLPRLENGLALLHPASAFVDASGALTTTNTGMVTLTTQLSALFSMRPGLRWSDGAPLSSADVIFGHRVTCDPRSGAVSFAFCEQVERLEALDATTWRVIYRPGRHDSRYFARLANAILPEHQLKDVAPSALRGDPRVAEHPLGWGPFRLDKGAWLRGRWLTLLKNEHYAGLAEGLPRMPRLIVRFLADPSERWNLLYDGELDLAMIDSLEAELIRTILLAVRDGKVRVELLASSFWEHLDFNLNDPRALDRPSLLADPLLRQAMAHGADRTGYAMELYGQQLEPLASFIPRDSWAYAGDELLVTYPYDPERASSMLDQAGYSKGADGVRRSGQRRLSFTLLTTPDAARGQIAALFQRDMQQLGIEITLDEHPAPTLFGPTSRLAQRNFELALFAWGGGAEPDLRMLYACEMIPRPENRWSGGNSMGWCNPRASEALARAESALAQDERKRWYTIVQQEFARDLPSLPLFPLLDVYPMAPDLHYVRPDPTEYVTWNVAEWEAPRGSR